MGKTQEHWTVEDFKKYQNKQTIRKDPKYRAKKTPAPSGGPEATAHVPVHLPC